MNLLCVSAPLRLCVKTAYKIILRGVFILSILLLPFCLSPHLLEDLGVVAGDLFVALV
jgi:hypothetical protein